MNYFGPAWQHRLISSFDHTARFLITDVIILG